MNIFVWKLYKIAAQKKVFFFTFFTFEVPFKGLFAPTSRSWRSNIFRDSESLRKSNRIKWSHIWTFLFGSGLKSPRKKKFFFADFALVHPPMASMLLSASVERCFVSRMRDFQPYTYIHLPVLNIIACVGEYYSISFLLNFLVQTFDLYFTSKYVSQTILYSSMSNCCIVYFK